MNPIEPTEQVSFLPKIELEFTKKNYAKTYYFFKIKEKDQAILKDGKFMTNSAVLWEH